MRILLLVTAAVFLFLRNASAEVSVTLDLQHQKAFLLEGSDVIETSPISSGRVTHPTPTGEFRITEKDIDHRSSLYGLIVDRKGNVVNASADSDTPVPSGCHFEQAPMRFFMRLDGAVGLHAGILPGYPASHGCVRMPLEKARIFFAHTETGTPVRVFGTAPYRTVHETSAQHKKNSKRRGKHQEAPWYEKVFPWMKK